MTMNVILSGVVRLEVDCGLLMPLYVHQSPFHLLPCNVWLGLAFGIISYLSLPHPLLRIGSHHIALQLHLPISVPV
jgi:hypothetical protein